MKVLFICTGNYYRSKFAEIYFNFLNKDKELTSYSRGLDISNPKNLGSISPYTVNYLKQLKVEIPVKINDPQLLEENDLINSDVVIAVNRKEHYKVLENKFPSFIWKIEFWDVGDLYEQTYENALHELSCKIELLTKDFQQ